MPVGYMFREQADKTPFSGWSFMAGDESQEYADAPNNWTIYDVNTVCNYGPAVIPFLDADFGTAFGRVEPDSGTFQQIRFLVEVSLAQRTELKVMRHD